jgi:hypothetical protein
MAHRQSMLVTHGGGKNQLEMGGIREFRRFGPFSHRSMAWFFQEARSGDRPTPELQVEPQQTTSLGIRELICPPNLSLLKNFVYFVHFVVDSGG